jgi:hypothetical protein
VSQGAALLRQYSHRIDKRKSNGSNVPAYEDADKRHSSSNLFYSDLCLFHSQIFLIHCHMKKNLLLLLVASFALLSTSCKKEKSATDGDYYISAKVNGQMKTYKADAVAVSLKVNDIYSIALSAKASTGAHERFFLTIGQRNTPLTSATYTDPGPLDDDLIVVGGYNPGTTNDAEVYAAGLQQDNNPRLQVNLTLTQKTVTGTFSGTYYDHGGDGPGTVAITEGRFNLPIVQ